MDVLFLLILTWAVKRLHRRDAALGLRDDGLVDHSTLFRARFLSWRIVKEVKIGPFPGGLGLA